MIVVSIRVLCLVLMFILIGLCVGNYKYFNILPESNGNKQILACNVLIYLFFIAYIGTKIFS